MEYLISWLGTSDPVVLGIAATAIIFGFYMAWNIGANDVANAMATSVGSGSLTYRQAIWIAAAMELAGAVLAGSHVTNTIRKGMIDVQLFAHDPQTLMLGMLAALLAAAVWLNIATLFGLPVSTTHSIVGAIVGFGLFIYGSTAIQWIKVFQIVLSWIISPLAGALIAYFLFVLIRKTILTARNTSRALLRLTPIFAGLTILLIVLATVYKGLKNLNLQLDTSTALFSSLTAGIIGAGIFYLYVSRRDGSRYDEIQNVERVFMVLQVATAAYVAFAHGANDVANAIGPMAAVFAIIQNGVIALKVPVPMWILLMGGVGIVIGLATWGYRVIKTVGKSITELTPTRGFSAEFSCATVVLVCSKLGLPVSTTHTLVGAVVGVGLAQGLGSVNLGVMRSIIASWLLTLPVAGGLTILIYLGLEAVIQL
ncbi:inorganic phosphate transporter [bacterium]|nr:MAG: inorganic phosphate transporter [bacterium]